ncbi:TetR/AcrR family transcriptional regulator [Rummeliibacillus pycnus]|uniref:TetR/AcrR family transcriptional regulator n=1 Tax=Rummeliibacillus pycnus TaxID=101070 RepID=UPI000C9BDF68|nr:TetR/AcrR family transcriptional regulator [Rummeliibacillus pycnus]
MAQAQSKQDRRILKTKNEIKQALTELIEEKRFEAITVRDITERANINRGTFYLHYQDKYDLLKQCEDEIIKNIIENVRDVQVYDIEELIAKEKPFPFIVTILEYIQENADFLRAVLGPNGDPSFQEKLKEVMIQNFFFKKLNNPSTTVPIDILTTYISSAHLGVIQQWLNTGMKQSPEEMASILFRIITKGPIVAIGFGNRVQEK